MKELKRLGNFCGHTGAVWTLFFGRLTAEHGAAAQYPAGDRRDWRGDVRFWRKRRHHPGLVFSGLTAVWRALPE
jgi:hypothetical protein